MKVAGEGNGHLRMSAEIIFLPRIDGLPNEKIAFWLLIIQDFHFLTPRLNNNCLGFNPTITFTITTTTITAMTEYCPESEWFYPPSYMPQQIFKKLIKDKMLCADSNDN